MVKYNGGSAFPIEADYIRGDKPNEYQFEVRHQPGMTLRDYFAGQYLTGAISIGNIGFNEIAKRAYEMADLMIAERDKDET